MIYLPGFEYGNHSSELRSRVSLLLPENLRRFKRDRNAGVAGYTRRQAGRPVPFRYIRIRFRRPQAAGLLRAVVSIRSQSSGSSLSQTSSAAWFQDHRISSASSVCGEIVEDVRVEEQVNDQARKHQIRK